MLMMIEKPRSTAAERGLNLARRGALALLAAADAAVMWPFRAAEGRRVMAELGAMSDRDLRDIGLTRQDLRDALALPAAEDPGRLLSARRGMRRPR